MRTVITVVAVCFAFSTLAVAEEPKNVDKQMTETVEGHSDVQDDSEIKIHMSDFAAKFIEDYVTPTICSYSPDFCARHQLQGRGIQSYLATAGTMFAGVLGIILTKIKILVVLSLVSTVVGKLLLLYAYLKSDHHHHHDYHSHGHHGHHHHHGHGHHHHVPYVKYTRDKYFIKHTPISHHSHDAAAVVDSPSPSPYHSHSPSASYSSPSGGVSYYKR